ncbi:unnamed protein product [Linum trigynum]|uniref:Uncharacterized protein n=1 Tax=Linum trigynum TaxID=586398 RepID=A0AAV2D019_9ROSI
MEDERLIGEGWREREISKEGCDDGGGECRRGELFEQRRMPFVVAVVLELTPGRISRLNGTVPSFLNDSSISTACTQNGLQS